MESIKIRIATKEDNIAIAPLILLAMDDLAYTFLGKKDKEAATRLFEYFIARKHNQYSYENTLVGTIDDKVVSIIIAYDGANLHKLRKPFLDYLDSEFGNKLENIKDETEMGEYYIDCISVLPAFQGQKIAGKMLDAVENYLKLKNIPTLGLIVEKEKTQAIHVYEKAGFRIVGEKHFFETLYFHMQKNIQ